MRKAKPSHESISTMHGLNLDIDGRQLFLFGEEGVTSGEDGTGEPGVEHVMSNRVIRNLLILNRTSHAPILIHMKTCGGDWREGMAIYDAIKASPSPIVIVNYTHARSMSSIIFQAAARRIMMPHSVFMFHDGSVSYGGTVKQFLTEARRVDNDGAVMIGIYTDRMAEAKAFRGSNEAGRAAWLREQMDTKEEVYLNAHDAIRLGFADAVFGEGKFKTWDSLTKGL